MVTVLQLDNFGSNCKDAWQSCQVAADELGQLAIIAFRHVLFNLAQHLLHKIVVVEQPFCFVGQERILSSPLLIMLKCLFDSR